MFYVIAKYYALPFVYVADILKQIMIITVSKIFYAYLYSTYTDKKL